MTDVAALRKYVAEARQALDRIDALLSPVTDGERYMRRGRLLVAARERVFPVLPKCLL